MSIDDVESISVNNKKTEILNGIQINYYSRKHLKIRIKTPSINGRILESRRCKKAGEGFRLAQSETEIPRAMLPHSA